MFAQLIVWLVFFAAYGGAFLLFMRWVARQRIRHAGQPSTPKVFASVMAGACCFAVIPGLFELVLRFHSPVALTKHDLGFAVFVALWVVAAAPGIASNRRLLRTAGIDPDAAA